jgi:molecular chaperone HtpG
MSSTIDMSDATANGEVEKYAFQAEINQLLSLIINSFYSNKEVFLRELLSNASDAIDKARYQALQAGSAAGELRVRLLADAEARTLTIEDDGVGMTKEELVGNLGTIARSGTKGFVEALGSGNTDVSLIGQFGVGFYSAYLVADRVAVASRAAQGPAHEWSSLAGGSFTVRVLPDDALPRQGTRVVLFLKEDQAEYLQEARLREVVLKHSAFLQHPLLLRVEREVDDVAPDDAADGAVEEVVEKKEPAKVKRTEWDLLNKDKPLWTLKPEDTTQEQHAALYKSLSNDWEDPLAYKQFHVEGGLEFRGVLYVPKRAPFDMIGGRDNKRSNIKLYVRRVFIHDRSDDIVPDWLGFVKGVVDSDDLPLNVSREMLQQSRTMKLIRKNVTKKCVELFYDLASDKPEDYAAFYDAFGKSLKLGVYDDDDNRSKLVDLLRFSSSADAPDAAPKRCSVRDYATRAREGQNRIYYIIGESLAQVQHSPFTERLRAKGYEVLYLVDPIDEYMMQHLREYECDGKTFQFVRITADGALFDDDESDDDKSAREAAFKPLCDAMAAELASDQVAKVVLSTRIMDTPAVLVTGQYSWSANMERIVRAQALADNNANSYMVGKRTLEINPDHRIVVALKQRLAADDAAAPSAPVRHLMRLLYETALLLSGFHMDDPSAFVQRVHRMMALGLCAENEVDEEEDDAAPAAATEARMEELD